MLAPDLTVVIFNVPRGFTAAEISELLWTRIGLHAAAEHITTKDHEYSTSAFIRIGTEDLVEFLTRNFESCILDGQRAPVRFEAKKLGADYKREREEKRQFRNYKVDYQTVITLPDGKR